MARVTNRQMGNVGNLGDIIKHAALMDLAFFLARTHPEVSYVDTHAFLLHAPLADRDRWNREVDALAAVHAGYARYAVLQRESLARTSDYRCSAGLVLDVLGDMRVCAVLGEANPATLAELSGQVAAESLTNVHVVNDAAKVDEDARVRRGGALLVHVDPFTLSPEVWSRIAGALDALVSRSADAAILVYRYSRNASTPWPDAPKGAEGPVAETRAGPHAFAAYASPGVADAVRRLCSALGWTSRDTAS